MTRKANRAEYSARMHRVLEFIDRHLDQELDLRTLASVAHFSSFHFHRVFFSWTGETVGDYLRRRRLEIAAARLAGQPKLSIFNVASSVGFGSIEAFARAFKVRFGCTASAWRATIAQQRNPGQELRNPDQGAGVSGADNALTVYPWLAANDQLGQPRYGISQDDPTITAPDKCRYDAAVEVRGKIVVSGDSHTTTIPGGQYAVTAFRGTADQIGGVWEAMLRRWLPSSGMQLDARPFFEYYPTDAAFDPSSGTFTCDIAIPVAPL